VPAPPVDMSAGTSSGEKTCVTCDYFLEENMRPYDARKASGATCTRFTTNVSQAITDETVCGADRRYWRKKFQMPKGL
jgi:hypothetical protein